MGNSRRLLAAEFKAAEAAAAVAEGRLCVWVVVAALGSLTDDGALAIFGGSCVVCSTLGMRLFNDRRRSKDEL